MAEPGPGPLPASSKWSVPGSLIACPALTRHKCIKINCGKLEYRTSKVYTIFPHFFWYIWYFILNTEKEKEYPFSHGYFDFTKVISDTFPLSWLYWLNYWIIMIRGHLCGCGEHRRFHCLYVLSPQILYHRKVKTISFLS